MTDIAIRLHKGVNKDLLPSELGDGWVSDAKNYRFRNGFAEAWGGMQSFATIVGMTLPLWVAPYASATTRFVIVGGNGPVYAYGATGYVITRYTDGAVISSITRVGTTATLTTSTNHGRTTGDSVSVYEAYPSQYNGTYTITVTGATTFTYTMASDPGASAAPVGAYSYNVTSSFTAATTAKWSGGAFNGLFLANNKTDGLYYWSGDTSVRLRKMPDLTMKADAARAFKNFIVLLGITSGGVKYPHRIAWSAAAEPGVIPAFTPSDTNEAGSGVDLAETAGHMVDCLPLGDVNIIYKQDARYAMQYVGGTDIFGFTRLPGNDGLLSINCVVDTPVGHVFLTNDLDVKVHNGGEAKSIASGRVKDWILSNVRSFQYAELSAFLCVNPDKDEVHVWIPTGTDAAPRRAAVWNWKDDTWSLFDVRDQGFGWQFMSACSGIFDPLIYPSGTQNKQMLIVAAPDGAGNTYLLINNETGYMAGAQMDWSLERTGLDLGDRGTVKAIHRSRWNIDGVAAGSGTAYHGSSPSADGAVTYSSGATYTLGTTDYANARATGGRFGAIKYTAYAVTQGYPLKVRSVDLDVRMGGKR